MPHRENIAFVVSLILLNCLAFSSLKAQTISSPHLRKQGTTTQLIVDGKPFLIRGGELGNSSASKLAYLRPFWDKLVKMNLNTVLVPVSWELIEPEEGKFNFALLDGLIEDARKHHLKIVPLWFGAWKNSMSSYAPAWVKINQKRFPRSESRDKRGMEILSPFSEENLNADASAFQNLMRHLKEFDGRENTVIMIQVENEIGMIPDSRDRSQVADKLFGAPVPSELMNYLAEHKDRLIPEFRTVWAQNNFRTRGTWEEIFGHNVGAEEIFMAWYFARYTNRIAAAGKTEYALPMYVNAALIRPNYQPGQYPSAGPLPHLLDVWRAGAPQIDFLAPDIYFPNFAEWTRKYQRSGNPLFIPEVQLNAHSGVNALYAVGAHDAMGFSPFAIESADENSSDLIRESYDLLQQLEPLIMENQGTGRMLGMLAESAEPQRVPQRFFLNGYTLNVTYERTAEWAAGSQNSPPPAGGLVIAVGPDEFIFAGTGLVVTFETNSPGEPIAGILSAHEGKFENGQWIAGRALNGDQTHQGRHLRIPPGKFSLQRIKLYRYH